MFSSARAWKILVSGWALPVMAGWLAVLPDTLHLVNSRQTPQFEVGAGQTAPWPIRPPLRRKQDIAPESIISWAPQGSPSTPTHAPWLLAHRSVLACLATKHDIRQA